MASKTALENATDIAKHLFGITAKAILLPGDEDENFKLKTTQGDSYILKISQPGVDKDYLKFQNEILKHLNHKHLNFNLPKVIVNSKNEFLSKISTKNGQERNVRLLTWLDGRLWAHVNPKTACLRFDLGMQAGKLTKALVDFNHPAAHRSFDWNLADASWTYKHATLFSGKEKELVSFFQQHFSELQPTL